MIEDWIEIEEFPDYSVSNQGRVCNDETKRILALLVNQSGNVHVGLTRERRQYKRSVALLVAKSFLDPPPTEAFDTPIHLDGDLTNNQPSNLMWRPRWFAIKYRLQFFSNQRGFTTPIIDTKTGEEFASSWDAATKYGLLDLEIMTATINRTFVWPTYQTFRVLQ